MSQSQEHWCAARCRRSSPVAADLPGSLQPASRPTSALALLRRLAGRYLAVAFISGRAHPFHRMSAPHPSSGKKKHININKFAGLSRDWVGAKLLNCLCVFFSGHSLWGRKTHKQSPPQGLKSAERKVQRKIQK